MSLRPRLIGGDGQGFALEGGATVTDSFATDGPKLKIVNDTPKDRIDGPEARRRVVAAALQEISRREAMVMKLERLDESVHAAALRTFESPDGPAEWFMDPAIGLGGAIPVKLARTAKGKKQVLWILGCIEHSVFI